MEIDMWHPGMDGKMVHIVQITKAGIRQYFTDGKLIMTKEVLKDGTIKET
ncbi:MAG: hypothetical protein WAX48_09185 [Desulfosalsimonadaceae bacterium]